MTTADEDRGAPAEPVFEGEAVELPAERPGPIAWQPRVPLSVRPGEPEEMPFPVAGEPIAVAAAGSQGDPVTTLGDSAEAFASGHAAAPGPSWQEPLLELAQERPELVVAAAFGGGLLTAMILRRLGN